MKKISKAFKHYENIKNITREKMNIKKKSGEVARCIEGEER